MIFFSVNFILIQTIKRLSISINLYKRYRRTHFLLIDKNIYSVNFFPYLV